MVKTNWIVSLKLRVLEGSAFEVDGSEFIFGECATLSDGEDDVIAQVLTWLVILKLELVEIVYISPIEEAPWIFRNAYRKDMARMIRNVKKFGGFTFGAFRTSGYLKMNEQDENVT